MSLGRNCSCSLHQPCTELPTSIPALVLAGEVPPPVADPIMENGHHAPNGHHKDLGRWHPLPVPAQSTRLRVNNSLIQEKVDFIPDSGGKQVTFYCCGPTTYAPSHVGHARCYLTFDIIRRIMEDYFGYEIYFVMNVTDVDDKIIKTARRNFLIDAYRKSAVDVNEVLADVEVAVAEEF
eukprot:TRINITY_DN13467_c0_g1_i2.p2 TRINITY_DN13467_c0_g1~~TRINITY_DN13467_c0_g1_i2.p2  ORF type:complete len:179 (+),score=26.14 TRINITY_DN13467_c0_g1_i2:101-637(+)